MKKILLFVLTLALTGGIVQAQEHDKDKDKDQKAKTAQSQDKDQSKTADAREDAGERAVHITSGPNVANVSGTSATLDWTTNKAGANDVHYNCGWGKDKIAYHRGGGTNHSVTLSGLKPNSTCTWKVMTHDGDLRKEGSFHTPGR
jgi:Ni/Co efflux regulator RcnB